MKPVRVFQWLVFGVGSAVAVYTGGGLILMAFTLESATQGQGLKVWAFIAPFLLLGLAALSAIPFAYRLLRKGRWLSMGLVLAAVAAVLPVLILIARVTIGPMYDEQGRPIQPQTHQETER